MFPIELVMFVGLAFGLLKLKSSFPNMMFPPTNVSVFLPPTEEEMKETQSSKKPSLQIKMIMSSSSHFIKMPFSNEMEITALFTLILFI